MVDTMEVVGNFRWNIETLHIPVDFIVNLWFSILQIAFIVHDITRQRWIKWQDLFLFGANPFSVNQNIKYECFQCAFQI